ncbi:Dyp-type peroxidase [Cylindrospermopsis raciborskii]|uniref:Dyp-type peroxidase n=1 Tax=Cylindrospermopsis raciborskii TaxID=77022 RepID=UPI0001C16832|nr:Dyp-type peroxidase [Cylindrospermopsis raciborskii]EFA71897.1 probable peroxidase [Raphidiopsis brookii D9]MCZ2201357.1 Dyp-type peroxidase [Cylindrospermopsis raciborskii PAMP2012]MCZ2206169.1 Dyp-type peroxidase [Cylindrospermopsis raciborskii PAMP2011]NLQ04805.1 Dyp-type peroxidase [Cylindrospermopsis raciborskii MVCC19]OHY33697.1 peroxidase [Cylindrospermopsis raciborskii MVCC14]
MALTEKDLQELPEDGIDPENPGKYEVLLKELQGNILRGHGRDYSVHLFLEFKPDKLVEVKQWIQTFAQKYLKSAKKQSDEAVNYRQNSIKGGLFTNFFLSCKGYEYLEIEPFLIPSDSPFRQGMKNENIRAVLGDPKVDQWESGFQRQIHALILIADDDIIALLQGVNQMMQKLRLVADIVHREDGFIFRNEAGQIIEHFGFVDGLSQPLFLKRDVVRSRIQDSGFSKWDSRAPLDIILTKDPNGKTEDSYGSYLVYRKLEQNVKKFRGEQESLAKALEIKKDLAGALVVGRFYDGTPVTLTDIPTFLHNITNNFNYDDDLAGTKCPFHSHVRKMNPRGDTGNVVSSSGFDEALAVERKHRIARRGVSYGSNDPAHDPETDSGLLFLCFQADIENQFNFMQTRWANATGFVQANVGPDPIIGQPQGTQKWVKNWGLSDSKPLKFELCVTMKGGEYFFAPSLSFLQNITD